MASRARSRRRFKSSTSRLTVQRYDIMGMCSAPHEKAPLRSPPAGHPRAAWGPPVIRGIEDV
jgi:hypothetical protein